MPRYISGRSKITPQTGLTSDRYKYLSVSEAEPNLGDPIVGPSSYTGSVPVGQQYMVVSIEGQDPGERYWIPNQGGIIPGSISVFEEDTLVGGLSSTTQLNFVGQSITAEGIGLPNPGVAVTITVAPPGNPNEILFVSAGSTDFATDTRFIFDDGLLKTGDRITVGTGGTVITTTGIGSVGIGTTQPTERLHLEGDFRITGTIYDSLNQPGDTGDLIVKTATGGLLWSRPNAIVSGAGGTIGQIQFHNTAGLVDGGDNFYYDFNNNRVGIGSTQPTQLLDVLGVSTFSGGVFVDNLKVSGITTANTILVEKVNVSGFSTFQSNVDIDASVDISTNLDVDGTTDLDILNVAETASFTDTTDNTLGNTNTGAVQIDGGVGIDKNLTVGQTIEAVNLNITGIGTIATYDFGVGQFDDITVLGVSTLGNIVADGNTIKTKTGTGNLTLDSDGASSIVVNDTLFVTKTTESTNKDSGSIITEGGIGVEKSVFIGLNLDVDGNTELDGLNVDGNTDLDTLNVSVATTTAKLRIGSGTEVVTILDEDNMSSDSDTALATQQSIKAYVDAQNTVQDLDFRGDSGTGQVNLGTEVFDIEGTPNEIETVGSGVTLTIGLPNDVTISNTLTVTGTASLNGNVDLGNAIADSISFIGQVDTDILPASDGSLDLGSSSKKWDNVHANTFVGAISGNADTATALINPRNFSISGDGAAPNVSFDGTADVDLVLTLDTVNSNVGTFGDSITVPQVTVNGKGLVTGVTSVSIDFGTANVATADSLSQSRNIAATGDIAWDVDFKGHEDVSGIATLATVFTAGTYGGEDTKVLSITADEKGRITGISSVNINFGAANVATADSLSNSRNIAATGDITWDVDFKGHENVTGVSTLKNVGPGAGTYGGEDTKVLSLSLDDKGRVTGISSVSIDFGFASVATADSLTDSRNIAATGDIEWNVDFKGHENVTGVSTLKNVGPGAGVYGGENTKVLSLSLDDKGRVTGISSVSIDFGLASVATADSLTDSRNIAATGDITWDVDFKGHENVTSTATLATVNSNVGTFGNATTVPQVTVNAKGLVTGVTDVSITFDDANVATADSLSQSRNIAATGDIAWNVDFKGHEDVTAAATLADIITAGTVGSPTQVGVVTFDAKGRITEATNVDINFGNATVGIASTANDLAGGAAGSIPYQDGPGSTVFLAEPDADDRVLTYNNTTDAPEWKALSVIPGAGTTLTIKEEGSVVGDLNGIDEINFVGNQITATGSGSNATITVTDVAVDQTAYTGDNPISVTSGNQVGIASTSNAYGRRYVQDTEPTGAVPGDIWYNSSGAAAIDVIAIPVGGIIMYSGTSLPSSNWALCDGNNGTPDLRNRFIMAAHSMSKTGTTSQAGPTFNATTGAVNESGQYEPGDIGGEAAHQLTEAELAQHNHSYAVPPSNNQFAQGGSDPGFNSGNTAGNTGTAGSNHYHENRPPYYALAFIMRIS